MVDDVDGASFSFNIVSADRLSDYNGQHLESETIKAVGAHVVPMVGHWIKGARLESTSKTGYRVRTRRGHTLHGHVHAVGSRSRAPQTNERSFHDTKKGVRDGFTD